MVALLTCAPVVGYGQEPFSRIEISAGGTFNVKEGNLTERRIHDYWKPGYGGELSFMTPFYFGDAEAAAAVHRYESLTTDVPSFDAILVYFGWGYDWEFFPGVSWYNGLRLGNNRMTFDDDTFPGVRNESEFSIAAQTRATIHFFQNTGVFASAQIAQTYTYIRFRAVYVSAGVTTSLSTPGWLQSLMR